MQAWACRRFRARETIRVFAKSAAGDGAQPEVITRKMMLEARTPAKDKKQKKKEPSKKLGVRFT